MKTMNTLLLATILSLNLHLVANAQTITNPFQVSQSLSGPTAEAITGFTLRHDQQKNYLEWKVSDNSQVSLLEVERSADGKSFSLAAVVFPGEKAADTNYMYYEKLKNRKTYYRVKIILRNGAIAYSPALQSGTE